MLQAFNDHSSTMQIMRTFHMLLYHKAAAANAARGVFLVASAIQSKRAVSGYNENFFFSQHVKSLAWAQSTVLTTAKQQRSVPHNKTS